MPKITLKLISVIMTAFFMLSALPVRAASPFSSGQDEIPFVPQDVPPSSPTDASILTSAVMAGSVSSGAKHTCMVTTSGGVKCWGDNSYGQLGNNSTTQSNLPVDVLDVSTGSALTGALSVSSGYYHTCALVTGGKVKCWGDNNYGELGNGSSGAGVYSYEAVDVLDASGTALLSNVKSIATLEWMSTCALLSSGAVACWGRNESGELGDGSTADRSLPVNVSGLSGVSAIGSGAKSVCVVMESGGGVRCWGKNDVGQLGDGTIVDSHVPVTVLPLRGVSAVSASYYHACALAGGAIKCWGNNVYGQLGTGDNINSLVPTNVLASAGGSPLSGVSAVSNGGLYTCAMMAGGSAKCWGDNTNGQLGNGISGGASINIPADVLATVGGAALGGIKAISSGDSHVCALIAGGGVKCWGDNTYGQLGDGTTTSSNVPVNVSGFETYTASGRVTWNGSAMAGVTITGGGQTAVTTSDGIYTLFGVVNGTLTVTPTKVGFVFTPASQLVTVSGADVSAIDFTAKPGFNSQFNVNGNLSGWSSLRGTWTVSSGSLLSPSFTISNSALINYNTGSYSKLDYSAKVMRTGCSSCFTSLFINGSGAALAAGGWTNGYQFSITRDGRYSVVKYVSCRATVLIPLRASGAVHRLSAWNVLRVTADGSHIYFYINGTRVWSGTPAVPISGKAGLGMVSNGTGGANRLTVDYATLTTP